ncbi:hypothetical protein glysoja_010229 [Glycine soja]|nr:hypothetical protein glysoja_010229 [Glycine soja]
MAIPKGTTIGLASIIVIIALILHQTVAQAVSPNGSVANNVSKPIKPDNTVRVDPLDHLKKYRGGFDITNKHYWSVIFFTGIYGYAIGVLWLLCGMVCGFFLLTIKFCCQSDGGRRTKKILSCNYMSCDFSPIPLAISFMILIMVASVLVYVGSSKFHYQARTSVNVIIKIADDASEIIHNVTRALEDIQENLVDSGISAEVSENLNSTAKKMDNAVDNIVKKTRKNKRTVNRAFKFVFVILCWLMTVICWLIFGLYFFLENFSIDTCTVLCNFEENPYNNSLTSILPCDELRSAKAILPEVGAGISFLITKVNSNLGPMFPNNVYLCNPFSAPPKYLYQPEFCPPNSIQIGDIPKVLKPYTCFGDSDENCGSDHLMNGGEYKVVEAYTSSTQNLLNMYPGMENLIGCKLVKDAFSQILFKHCKALNNFARMAWVAMVFLAVMMVFYVVLSTIKACQDHSSYHPSDDSV